MSAPFSQNLLWPLIEERAERTPDLLFAVDERERRMTFGEYRDAALRCAAGLQSAGVAADTVVSWQLPTTFEALVLVAGLARLGAVQNPILPILREREVSFITEQTGARFLFIPRVFRGFDFEAMARAVTRDRGTPEIHVVDDGLPDGDPAGLGAFPTVDVNDAPCAGSSTAPERPPIPRVRGTRTSRSRDPAAPWSAASKRPRPTDTRSCSRSRTSADSTGSSRA